LADLRDFMIFCDLDGTLVLPDFSMPAANVTAANILRREGGVFTIASGRVVQSAQVYAEAMELTVPAICNNGATFYDFVKGEALSAFYLPENAPELLEEIVARYPTLGVEVIIDDSAYIARENQFTVWHQQKESALMPIIPPEKLPTPWTKILLADDPARILEMVPFFESTHIEGVDTVRSGSYLFEMLPAGVNKGVGLRSYCERFADVVGGRRTVAIGDYYNDLEMLRAADIALVPAGAPDALKAEADGVLCPTEEGVLASALEFLRKL